LARILENLFEIELDVKNSVPPMVFEIENKMSHRKHKRFLG